MPTDGREPNVGRTAAVGQWNPAGETARHLRAVVEYDGTAYHGFQIQANAWTVQVALQEALASVTQEHIDIRFAGRTDTGVHAVGQVVDFRTGWSRALAELQRAWNAVLPLDIVARALEPAPPDFHSRYSATSRVYRYGVWNRPIRSPLHARWFHHVAADLDADRMARVAQVLIGEHDFRTFGAPTQPGGTTVRCVRRIDVWRSGDGLFIEIEGNAFLRRMVRRISVALIAVGRGRLTGGELAAVLAAADPGRLQGAAPPNGLCLMQVNY